MRWGLNLWRGLYFELPPQFLLFLYQVWQILDLAAFMVALLVVLDSGLGHTFGAGDCQVVTCAGRGIDGNLRTEGDTGR